MILPVFDVSRPSSDQLGSVPLTNFPVHFWGCSHVHQPGLLDGSNSSSAGRRLGPLQDWDSCVVFVQSLQASMKGPSQLKPNTLHSPASCTSSSSPLYGSYFTACARRYHVLWRSSSFGLLVMPLISRGLEMLAGSMNQIIQAANNYVPWPMTTREALMNQGPGGNI